MFKNSYLEEQLRTAASEFIAEHLKETLFFKMLYL